MKRELQSGECCRGSPWPVGWNLVFACRLHLTLFYYLSLKLGTHSPGMHWVVLTTSVMMSQCLPWTVLDPHDSLQIEARLASWQLFTTSISYTANLWFTCKGTSLLLDCLLCRTVCSYCVSWFLLFSCRTIHGLWTVWGFLLMGTDLLQLVQMGR